MGWAFCVWFGVGVFAAPDGSVESRVFDGRVGRYEFAMGVDYFFVWADVAWDLGSWVDVGSANLGWLKKILLVCLAWDWHWDVCLAAAWRGALICRS